jgi:4-amino-4-deoxy-L-arabinose transferase-like glycosyltransferase
MLRRLDSAVVWRRWNKDRVRLALLVLLGSAIRLVWITEPFVDHWSWRQSDVAMIAANFYRHGFDFFHPQIDWAGNEPGYVGTEFPLVPYIAALAYVPFGLHEWIGRSVSVAFFALSMPYLWLLVRTAWNARIAHWATAIYAVVPLGIISGRSFMPDMASLSLSVVALSCFANWLTSPSTRWVFASGFVSVAALAILIKLPAITIGLPLVYMAVTIGGRSALWRRDFLACAAGILGVTFGWYYYAYLAATSNPPYHMFGERGLTVLSLERYWEILKVTVNLSLTPILVLGTVAGISVNPVGRFRHVFAWWALGICLFVVLAGEGNRHEWYRLPLVPVASAYAGVGLDRLWRRVSARYSYWGLTFVAILLASFAVMSARSVATHYDPLALPARTLGLELRRLTPSDALILVADGGDPTTLYYSDRRGWHFLESFGSLPASDAEAINELERLRARGATYLGFDRYSRWWLNYYQGFRTHLLTRYTKVESSGDHVIFDLSRRTAPP